MIVLRWQRRSGWSVEHRRLRFGDVVGWALPTLIALKLAAVIGWSWWWVLAPPWIQAPAAVLIGLFFLYGAFNLTVDKLAEWWTWRRLQRHPDW